MNFRSPGGDRHISLDPIKDGEFTSSRLRLCVDVVGLPGSARVLADRSRVAVDLGGVFLWFSVTAAMFGQHSPRLTTERDKGTLVVSLDLVPVGEARTIRWRDVPVAFAAFALTMRRARGTLEAFENACRRASAERSADTVALEWNAPSGRLAMSGSVAVKPVANQDRAYSSSLNGQPIPLERLSREPLA